MLNCELWLLSLPFACSHWNLKLTPQVPTSQRKWLDKGVNQADVRQKDADPGSPKIDSLLQGLRLLCLHRSTGSCLCRISGNPF